ncbi:MAG: hypothetical protein HY802_03630 [Methanobacterium sp.]|nr:hypothetical protein [Methanobacterium sp.]
MVNNTQLYSGKKIPLEKYPIILRETVAIKIRGNKLKRSGINLKLE